MFPMLESLRPRAAFAAAALLWTAQLAPARLALAPLQEPVVVAHADDTLVTAEEYHELLTGRRAMSDEGRKALKHLLRARLLDRLASESKLVVSSADVDARWKELEKEIAASGEASTLDQYLRRQKVEAGVFREFLRLAIVQETLSRRALGIPEGTPVPAEQQEMWLDQIVETRGTELVPPPWKDGIAARCGDLAIPAKDFLEHLRRQLPADDVSEDCYQLLLLKRVRARLPDLAPDALSGAVETELARRRAEVAADPQYKGLAYEQIMAAQGLQAWYLPRDPSVQIAALAQVWVDRTQGPEGLRKHYEKERAWFDGHFGAAVNARAVFLRAAVLTNPLIPRTFDQAERELAALLPKLSTAEDFGHLAKLRTEWTGTREKEGSLGWVTEGNEEVPGEIRAALFARRSGSAEPVSGVIGPVKITTGEMTGCALLWAGARRAAPGWEEMSGHVHRDLRRRFLEEVLPRASVRTWLDAD
jgi:PPIC-type peptidyl-prolyl cis-trans isomerase-like protein